MNRLLGECSLEVLRRRRGWTWTEYPPDVLPAWVAEMDFDLAEPVKDAVTQAMTASDCGYPNPGRVAVNPGQDFGAQGRGFVRLNIGTSPALLEKIVRRMANAIGAGSPSPAPVE